MLTYVLNIWNFMQIKTLNSFNIQVLNEYFSGSAPVKVRKQIWI